MIKLRSLILAFALSASLVPALAQVPPPVPALPDTERRTSYSISGTTCACAVNFALYGDSTDYQNWVEVWLNGVQIAFNDSTKGWTITVPTQTLATRARPITDAVLTFNVVQTGTVQIVGARRPRRTSQFNEGTGVPTRNFNLVLSDIISQNREIWDKNNDMTGRGIFAVPGETLTALPLKAARASGLLGFDVNGNPITISPNIGLGTVVGPNSSVDGHVAVFNGVTGQLLKDGGPTVGTVSSVALALPALFTISGSPVTTAGTLTATLANQSANLIWAGPNTGAAAAPTFRSLVVADLPAPFSALGTGVATALGVNVGSAGAFVAFNGAGGTPSGITLTNGTGLPIAGIASLGSGVATWLGTPTPANLNTALGVTVTQTIASGSTAMGTGAILSATCTTVVTATATNALTTDVLAASFNGDPTAVTGYAPLTSGGLTIFPFLTANTANFKVCNPTSGTITPGAVTLNWRVTR